MPHCTGENIQCNDGFKWWARTSFPCSWSYEECFPPKCKFHSCPLLAWQTSIPWWEFLLGMDVRFCQMCLWHLFRWSCFSFSVFQFGELHWCFFLLNQACVSINTMHWLYSDFTSFTFTFMCVFLQFYEKFMPCTFIYMKRYWKIPYWKVQNNFITRIPCATTLLWPQPALSSPLFLWQPLIYSLSL